MTLVMFKSAAGLNNYDVIRESLGMKINTKVRQKGKKLIRLLIRGNLCIVSNSAAWLIQLNLINT